MSRPRSRVGWAAVAIALLVPALVAPARAQLTSTSTSLSFGKDASLRSSRPFAATSATATITAPFPVFWEMPTTGSLYAAVGVPPSIRPGQLLGAADLSKYSAASIRYEAPNHPYVIQSMDQGGTVAITARVGAPDAREKIATTLEYGRMKIAVAIDGGSQIRLGALTNLLITVPPGFGPVSQIRIDFGTEVEVTTPGIQGTGRVFTVPTPRNPMPLLVTYPPDYGSQNVLIKVVATSGSFTQADAGSAEGSGLTADGATISGAGSFPTVKAGTRRPGGAGAVGQATASTGALAFGKEKGLRGSMPLSAAALNPSQTVITAPGPAIWELPKAGSIYAATSVPGVSAGTLLFAGNLATYNAACPTTVLFEADNHPYIIQAMSQGGQTIVGGVLAGAGCAPTSDRFAITLPWGRDRIKVEVAGGGKVTLGTPVEFVFTLPSTFTGATLLRVDFGADVLGPGGVVARVFTVAAPGPITVTYPPTYTGSGIKLEAVATTLAFLEAAPLSASGAGLQASGATVSGVGSFQVEKARPGTLTVTKVANRPRSRAGQQVTYRIVVENASSFAVTGVRVWDSHLGELDGAATLAPGAAVTSVRTVTLDQTTRNIAHASARDPFGNTINGRSEEVRVEVIRPEIALRHWARPGRVKFGKEVVLHWEVSNTGDQTLINVQVPGADGQPIAKLEPGQTRTLTAKRTFPPGTASPVVNNGTASATVESDPGGGAVAASQDAEIELIDTGLSVTITPDKTQVKSGGKVTFTIVVTNTGQGDLSNLTVTDDQLGPIGNIKLLTPGQSETFTKDATPTQTRTHTTKASGTDDWDPISAEASATVTVIHPAIQVGITADGSGTSITVHKGTKVDFEVTVTNAGDCELTDVQVNFRGGNIHTIPTLAPGASAKAPTQSQTVDKDESFGASASGRDPEGGSVSQNDAVLVKADIPFLGKVAQLAGDLGRVLDHIDQLVVKQRAAHKDFDARLALVKSTAVKPCDDGELMGYLQTAASIHARAVALLKEMDIILKSLADEPDWKAAVAKGALKGVDPLDLLGRTNTARADKEPEIKKHLEDMRAAWKAAGCKGAPGGKEWLVNIAGKVVDKKGAGVAGASVTVNGKTYQTDGGGGFHLVLPLNDGDVVTASASKTIAGGFLVVESGSATYDNTDPLPLLITLDTSPNRAVTVKGNVFDKAGKGLGNATVTSRGVSTTTDAAGDYALVVDAELGKPVEATATVTTASGDKPAGQGAATFNGEAELTIPIRIAGAETPQEFAIAGQVTDANGAPLANVAITADGVSTTTDAGGNYTVGVFQGITGKKVNVTASFTDAAGKAHSQSVAAEFKGFAAGLTVNAPTIVFADLAKVVEITVSGRVVDAKGTGLVGATVTLPGGGSATTGAGGAFSGLGPVKVPSGQAVKVDASVTMKGGQTGSGSSSVSSKTDGEVSTTITIAGAVTEEAFVVTGRVVDSKGKGLAGATVTVGGWSGTTGAGGAFTSAEMSATVGTSFDVEATVVSSDGKARSAQTSVTYSGGKTANAGALTIQDVVVQEPFQVSGRVVDSKGNPLAGAAVTAGKWSGTSGGDGRFVSDPLSEPPGTSVTVRATVTASDGKARSAATAVTYEGGAAIDAGTVRIGDVVAQEPFTVTGRVVDSKGKPLSGAAVTVGGWSGSTGGDGGFTAGPLTEKVGTRVDVKATVTTNDGQFHSGGSSVSYEGGAAIDAGVIRISDVEVPIEVGAVSLSPANPIVKIGETITFLATAEYKDKTRGDVTLDSQWPEGKNTFVATTEGTFTMTATYMGVLGSAVIKVGPVDLGAAIDTSKKGSDPCTADALNGKIRELQGAMAEARDLRGKFDAGHARFHKEINDQRAKPCKNALLATAFVGCQRNLESFRTRGDGAKGLARDVISLQARCPALVTSGGFDAEGALRDLTGAETTMNTRLQEMNDRLRAQGCDPNDVKQIGNQNAGNTNDPNVIGDGGAGAKEICGDGVDNDGDGLQDEDCGGVTGSNVTIILFDSGNAKDDSFLLTVSSIGQVGTTAPGARQSFPVTLSPGSYTATVTVVLAPDDVGTFTVTVMEGSRVLATQSGQPGQGAASTLGFTVGGPAPSAVTLPQVNYNKVTFDEVAEKARRAARKKQ